jgi:Bifunctional DNA primase/polymerase, N-terminal
MTGIFSTWQPRYAEHGIATVPVDPETKVSRLPWQKIGLPASAKMAQQRRHQDCDGIGFACGRYNDLTVLDIDTTDQQLLREALKRHGDTPIIEKTASGKFHAWYRHNDEPRSCRQASGLSCYQMIWGEDVPIDLLGGGLSVATPTLNSRGTYEFIRGGLQDIPRLPVMRGLEQLQSRASIILPDDVIAPNEERASPYKIREGRRDTSLYKIREGRRDTSLWQACMRYAKQAQTFDELLAFARAFNEENIEPMLHDSIVVEKCASAWRYETLGLNTFGQRAVIVPERIGQSVGPDAIYLFMHLQHDFFWTDEFPMASTYGEKFGMGRRRLYKATAQLIAAKVIKRLSTGGRFEGDAPLYAWIKGRKQRTPRPKCTTISL